jgi:hypothetical protein
MVYQWFGLKTTVTVLSDLASKLVVMISPSLTSKSVLDFLVEYQNQGAGGFSDLGLKIGSYVLIILVSKSQRQFIGLCLKTKRDSV